MRVCPDVSIWFKIFDDRSKESSLLKAKLLKLGDRVLNHPLVQMELALKLKLSLEQAEMIGFGFKDGSCPRFIDDMELVEGFIAKHRLYNSNFQVFDIWMMIFCIENGHALWTRNEDILQNAFKIGLTIFDESQFE